MLAEHWFVIYLNERAIRYKSWLKDILGDDFSAGDEKNFKIKLNGDRTFHIRESKNSTDFELKHMRKQKKVFTAIKYTLPEAWAIYVDLLDKKQKERKASKFNILEFIEKTTSCEFKQLDFLLQHSRDKNGHVLTKEIIVFNINEFEDILLKFYENNSTKRDNFIFLIGSIVRRFDDYTHIAQKTTLDYKVDMKLWNI